MKFTIGMRQVINDSECFRCGNEKPLERKCGICAIENGMVVSSQGATLFRNIDRVEHNRDERLRQSRVNYHVRNTWPDYLRPG